MSAKDIQPYKGKRKALLETLADSDNTLLSTIDICRTAGISKESYYKYTKEENFQQALRDLSIAIYVRHLPQTVNSVVKQSKKGNINANRLIHDAIGMTGKGGPTVNVGVTTQPTHETKDYDSPAEAIADIDKTIVELKAYRASIVDKQADRLKGHGIHQGTGDDHHEQV